MVVPNAKIVIGHDHKKILTKLPQLAVLASGSGSNFGAIAQAIAQDQIPAQLSVLIYNNPTAHVRTRAEQLGIPHILLNHRTYSSREALDHAIVAVLQAHNIDLVIMAGWMRIVTPILIDAYHDRILNIHPSLLPSFPGAHAIEQALAYGVKISGCTVHLVIPPVDRGKILAQAAVTVEPDDTPQTLQARIHQQEYIIYPKAIAAYLKTFTTADPKDRQA